MDFVLLMVSGVAPRRGCRKSNRRHLDDRTSLMDGGIDPASPRSMGSRKETSDGGNRRSSGADASVVRSHHLRA
jgi:hypothetical protein